VKNPKILLLYPSSYNCPPNWHREEVKSSLLLLASYLEQYYSVEYVDFELTIGRPESTIQVRRFDRRVREYLENAQYDILAISCWTSLSYQATMTAARIARELYPHRLIVVGGYHPSARPEDFVTANNLFDYVVQNEGELALKEIVATFAQHGRPAQTQIIVGPPVAARDFPAINWKLLDAVTPVEARTRVGTVPIYLSRGCPFSCSFCMESLKHQDWRAYDVSRAIAVTQEAVAQFPNAVVGYSDACFGLRREWRKEFLRRLADLHLPQQIIFETRPEYLDDEDIKLLADLRAVVQFGIESCSPRMLRLMQKSRQPSQFLDRFREISHQFSVHGIVHGANIIFNHPGETEETLNETFAFIDSELARGHSSLMWVCHGYMHFPGSAIARNQSHYEKEFGARFPHPQWWFEEGNAIDLCRDVIPSDDLSGERVGLWRRMYQDREETFKSSLTPTAFKVVAQAYYTPWMLDARYDPNA
jgi:radical SAM superfamily enzyme YgiQ (UPF0313 family)